MPKLSEMSYWELKGLERALYYLMNDNPELAGRSLEDIYEILSLEKKSRKDEYCPKSETGLHQWKDCVDTYTNVDGTGHLVLICKACGYILHLEDT